MPLPRLAAAACEAPAGHVPAHTADTHFTRAVASTYGMIQSISLMGTGTIVNWWSTHSESIRPLLLRFNKYSRSVLLKQMEIGFSIPNSISFDKMDFVDELHNMTTITTQQ